MRILFLTIICFISCVSRTLGAYVLGCPDNDWIPTNIRLALGNKSTEMVVQFWTSHLPENAMVRYGRRDPELNPGMGYEGNAARIATTFFHDNLDAGFFHYATLENLQVDTSYNYIVSAKYEKGSGSNDVYMCNSRPLQFRTVPLEHRRVCIAAVSNGGSSDSNKAVLEAIASSREKIELVVWPGNLALSRGALDKWSEWERLISDKLGTRIPFFFAPGPQDSYGDIDLAQYKKRVYQLGPRMEADHHKHELHSATNFGPFHLLSLNSLDDVSEQSAQYKFAAETGYFWNKFDRAKSPWYIALFNRAFVSSILPAFGEDKKLKALRDLLRGGDVDVVLSGDQRVYQRTHPMRSYTEYGIDGSIQQPYRGKAKERGTVYANVGTGGAFPRPNDTFEAVPPEWSAIAVEQVWGFTRLCSDDQGRSLSWEFVPVQYEEADGNDIGEAAYPRDRAFFCQAEEERDCHELLNGCAIMVEAGSEWFYTTDAAVESNADLWNTGYDGNSKGVKYEPEHYTDLWSGPHALPIGVHGDDIPAGLKLNIDLALLEHKDDPERLFLSRSFELSASEFGYTRELEIWVSANPSADVFFNGVMVDNEATRGVVHPSSGARFRQWRRLVVVRNAETDPGIQEDRVTDKKVRPGEITIGVNVIELVVDAPGLDGFQIDVEVRARGAFTHHVGEERITCGVPPKATVDGSAATTSATKAPAGTTKQGEETAASTVAATDMVDAEESGPSGFALLMLMLLGCTVLGVCWWWRRRRQGGAGDSAPGSVTGSRSAQAGAQRRRFEKLEEEEV